MVRISTYKWDDVIDKLDGFRDVLDRLIETRIGDRATNARQLADKMVELTCEEIDRRLAEHSSGATVDHARKWSPLYVIVHGKESTSPHSG